MCAVLCTLIVYLYRTIIHLYSLIESHGVSYHQFADDTQLLVAMNVTDAGPALEKLVNCSTAVRLWFLRNDL